MNEKINISQIENWLHGKLKGKVSSHVFPGSIPDVLNETWNDIVVIDVQRVTDTSEYGRVRGVALVQLWVYVKPNSSGRKNVSHMNKLEEALSDLIEHDRDPHYSMSELYSQQGYYKPIGYHYKTLMIQIQIY